MATFVPSCGAWLRWHFTWSNSRQSWTERLAGTLLVSAAAGAWWYGRRWPGGVQFAVAVALVTAAALVLRRGWLKLFGPVLGYDLVRTARRLSLFRFRMLYAGLLGLVTLVLWLSGFISRSYGAAPLFEGMSLSPREMAQLNAVFTVVFLGLQFLIACLLTPPYVAGPIVEEKVRRTLEYLLASDLRNHEIVLSLLVSRTANLLLVLLTGLPILAFLQFLGGVDPELLLAGFAATAWTIASLAGLSVVNSVYARRPLQAIVLTYLEFIAYMGVTACARLLVLPGLALLVPGVADFPSTEAWTSPVTLGDIVDWSCVGNPVTGLIDLEKGLDAGTPLDSLLPDILASYAWFHGLVALACTVWAVLRLRAVALRHAAGPTHKNVAQARERGRRWIGPWPMVWKEMVGDAPSRARGLARLGLVVVVAASILPGLGILGVFIYFYPAPWTELKEAVNIWVRIAGTTVAGLLLLRVALRGATSVIGERDRQTLDGLLTTPLGGRAILFAKWLGSMVLPGRAWLWLGSIWLLAYLLGGLDPWAVPCLLLAWIVYAAFLAALGLWFSVSSQRYVHAVLATLLVSILMMGGHWMVWLLYVALLDRPWFVLSSELAMAASVFLLLLGGWYLVFGRKASRGKRISALLLLLPAGGLGVLAFLDVPPPFLTAGFEDTTFAFHMYTLTPPATLDLISQLNRPATMWTGRPLPEAGDRLAMIALAPVFYGLAAVILGLLAGKRFRRTAGPFAPPAPSVIHTHPVAEASVA